jgi:hypothetical protein
MFQKPKADFPCRRRLGSFLSTVEFGLIAGDRWPEAWDGALTGEKIIACLSDGMFGEDCAW